MKSLFKSIVVVFLMLTVISVKQSFAQNTPQTPETPESSSFTFTMNSDEPSQEETLRTALEADGYLLKKGRKTKYSFSMEDGEILINGKEITGKTLKKYSDLMEDLYGDINSATIRLSMRGENNTALIISIED